MFRQEEIKQCCFFCHEIYDIECYSLINIEFSIKLDKYKALNLRICNKCKKTNYNKSIPSIKHFLLDLSSYIRLDKLELDEDEFNSIFRVERLCQKSNKWIVDESWLCLICGEEMGRIGDYLRFSRMLKKNIINEAISQKERSEIEDHIYNG